VQQHALDVDTACTWASTPVRHSTIEADSTIGMQAPDDEATTLLAMPPERAVRLHRLSGLKSGQWSRAIKLSGQPHGCTNQPTDSKSLRLKSRALMRKTRHQGDNGASASVAPPETREPTAPVASRSSEKRTVHTNRGITLTGRKSGKRTAVNQDSIVYSGHRALNQYMIGAKWTA
jgi:hypothetical protein